MPVDFRGVIFASMLWLFAMVLTFILRCKRLIRKQESHPYALAALYTFAWSILFSVLWVALVLLYDVLEFSY